MLLASWQKFSFSPRFGLYSLLGQNMYLCRLLIAHPQVCSPLRVANHMVGLFDLFSQKNTPPVPASNNKNGDGESEQSTEVQPKTQTARWDTMWWCTSIILLVPTTFTRNTTFDPLLMYKKNDRTFKDGSILAGLL